MKRFLSSMLLLVIASTAALAGDDKKERADEVKRLDHATRAFNEIPCGPRNWLRGQDLNLRPLGYEFENIDACALLSILYVPSLSLFSHIQKPVASQLRPENHPRTPNDEGVMVAVCLDLCRAGK
jgi:hypothetical protein